MGTDLESTEWGSGQDSDRKWAREGYSQTQAREQREKQV